jgi:hypothetical protein
MDQKPGPGAPALFFLQKNQVTNFMQVKPGLYQHYKGPQYRVFGVARHSEDEQQVVVYQALYGDRGLWVRPLSMFCEQVEVNGTPVPRFALIEAEPSLFGSAEQGGN